jgi:AcrR family transcriptional regulator
MSSYRMKAAALSKITSSRNEGEERIRTRNERQILKAATIVFSRKGFDGTRIAEIAKQAGLPKANVYYYFSSKEDIYAAAIAQLIQGWDDALEHISRDREPIESLEAYVRAKLDYSRRNGEESRMFAAEILRGARFLSRKDRIGSRAAKSGPWIRATSSSCCGRRRNSMPTSNPSCAMRWRCGVWRPAITNRLLARSSRPYCVGCRHRVPLARAVRKLDRFHSCSNDPDLVRSPQGLNRSGRTRASDGQFSRPRGWRAQPISRIDATRSF